MVRLRCLYVSHILLRSFRVIVFRVIVFRIIVFRIIVFRIIVFRIRKAHCT